MKTKHELIKAFEETLNETNEGLSTGHYNYIVSEVLKVVDPIAYREELLNWANHECSQGFITQQEYDSL